MNVVSRVANNTTNNFASPTTHKNYKENYNET